MKLLKNFTPKILVIGDLMIDHYLWGSCERISPEAPVQVVDIAKETTVLGGAGNVINNLNALGAEVSVSSVIGDDNNGVELKNMLDSINVNNTNLIIQKSRKTSKKSRIIAVSQQILRYDKESKNEIESASVKKILGFEARDLMGNVWWEKTLVDTVESELKLSVGSSILATKSHGGVQKERKVKTS
mgnify:CR=1 FL=1